MREVRGDGVLVAAIVLACVGPACGGDDPPRPGRGETSSDAVQRENEKPGDPSWAITVGAAHHEVEGYGSRISVRAGESFTVAVNVDKPRTVAWSLYRVGFYGGAGGRLIQAGAPVAALPQPPCGRDPVTARVECRWAPSFTVAIPQGSLSGLYLVKLSAGGVQWYVPVVVTDVRTADIVYDVNVLSWQAYNPFGGESLYRDDSGTMPHRKAWEVSFDRPFADGFGSGHLHYSEIHALVFLEALGYDVTYTTGVDLAHDGSQVGRARAFLSVGNDEYWLPAERDAVESARDHGVNLAFLGADQGLWRVRLGPSSTGTPERVMACYKSDQARDPVLAALGPSASTARFRDDPGARPENELIGVMYNTWLLVPQPWVVADPTHWIFAGTGLASGDALPSLVAYETDDRFANGVEPSGLHVLARSPLFDAEGTPAHSTATAYRHPSGAEVVGLGSLGWADGLGQRDHVDARVATITRNILDRLVGSGRRGAPDPAGAPWRSSRAHPATVDARWAHDVSTIAGAALDASPVDGPGATARFIAPSGIAVGADGSVYVADAPAHQIRLIAPDAAHTVSTLAGDGIDGMRDGPGAAARFRWPAGMALGADGTLYVADADNQVIRAVAPDAAHTVSTYAGIADRSGGFADGPGATARFNRPAAIAIAPDGALLVADMHGCRIRRVDPGAGHVVSTYTGAGVGYADGAPDVARFNNPSGIAVAPDGTAYVIDTFNGALRRIAPGSRTVTTLVGNVDGTVAAVDGPGTSALLSAQGGLAHAGGRLVVTDVGADRIRVIEPGATAALTNVYTLAGSGRVALADGAGATAAFAAPVAVAAAPDGSLFVADSGNHAVRRIVP